VDFDTKPNSTPENNLPRSPILNAFEVITNQSVGDTFRIFGFPEESRSNIENMLKKPAPVGKDAIFAEITALRATEQEVTDPLESTFLHLRLAWLNTILLMPSSVIKK
jgi:hypothetical protein